MVKLILKGGKIVKADKEWVAFLDNKYAKVLVSLLDGAKSAASISNETGLSYESVYSRLRQLNKKDLVDRSNPFWYITKNGKGVADAADEIVKAGGILFMEREQDE